jgi:hypothetical protein
MNKEIFKYLLLKTLPVSICVLNKTHDLNKIFSSFDLRNTHKTLKMQRIYKILNTKNKL